MKSLEKAFVEFNPNVDLEAVVSGAAVSATTSSTATGSTDLRTADYRGSGERLRVEVSESLPQTSSGFDWKEESAADAEPTDGMGALSVDPQGVGYLGAFLGF